MTQNWTSAWTGAVALALLWSANGFGEEPDLIPSMDPEPSAIVVESVGEESDYELVYASPGIRGRSGRWAQRRRVVAPGTVGPLAAAVQSGQPIIDPALRADWIAQQRAAQMSWHAGYYHTQWGGPVPLMVPPNVRTHTRSGWGVAQTTVEPLYQQYQRAYPGGSGQPGLLFPLRPTPRWPSHTDQFGVYYIRGPW